MLLNNFHQRLSHQEKLLRVHVEKVLAVALLQDLELGDILILRETSPYFKTSSS